MKYINILQTPKFGISLNHRITEISKITSKKVYSELIGHVVKAPTAIETWLNLFPFLQQIEWNSVFTLVYKITKEPYLQSFQYKILNRTLNCRYNLYKWNISSSPTCIYCTQTNTDSVLIFFVNLDFILIKLCIAKRTNNINILYIKKYQDNHHF